MSLLHYFPVALLERGWLPDALVKLRLHQLIARGLMKPSARDPEQRDQARRTFLERAGTGPLAARARTAQPVTASIPAECFQDILGSNMTSLAGLFEPNAQNLDQAEHAMLALIAERARLRDGQQILELGCGWGGLALWLAHRLPNARIHAVTESSLQAQWITQRINDKGLTNITVEQARITDFKPRHTEYHRVVCLDQLGKIRNYREFSARLGSWLYEHGRLFLQTPAHKYLGYRLDEEPPGQWLAEHFWGGLTMPIQSLPAYYQQDLLLRDSWWLSGRHMQKTAQAWLARLDSNQTRILSYIASQHGMQQASKQFQYWRLTYLALSELFGYDNGDQWGVAHYLLTPRQALQTGH